MDIAKLEKMKVVDLRTELQSRGLDTKGVKAVLIERLKAVMDGEGGVPCPGTPGTPGRRSRRTRSMTRSPSPSPVKKVEPTLEPLAEEETTTQSKEIQSESPEDEEKICGDSELNEENSAQKELDEAEPSEDISDENDADATNAETVVEEEVPEVNDDRVDETEEDAENNPNETVANAEPSVDDESEENAEHNAVEDDEMATELVDDKDDEMNGENASIVENETIKQDGVEHSGETEEENHGDVVETNETTAQESEKSEADNDKKSDKDEKLGENSRRSNRKRSYSASRSTSRSKERRHSCSKSRSNSRSRSRSPKRRSGAGIVTSPKKSVEEPPNPEDEPTIEDKQLGLSWFDSDLHLRIDPVTFASAKPMTHEVFSLLWSGARTNYGVREGKVCYEVRIAEEMPMNNNHQFRDEPHVRGMRIGFSLPNSTLLLGEAQHSFAYCESGRKANNSEFTEYGKPFKLDDVIGCYLDLESTPCNIKYTLNGEDLGVAFEFENDILGENCALFPHIVTKGYEYHVNFADNENLLGNVERPKRLRKKQRKEEEKEELTDGNQENWQIVDEAKDDDEDKDNAIKSDETVTQEKDNEEEGKEKDSDKAEIADVDMKESTTDAQAEETCEEKEDTSNEDVNNESAVITDVAADVVSTESAKYTTEENEKLEEGDKKSKQEDKKSEEEEDKKSEEEEEDKKSEKESAPSPSKKQKLTKENEKSAPEDEFEEVEPEARDPVELLPGYELIALVPEEQYIAGPQRPGSRKECEVILLVGLPGAGKTHWTLNHLKENDDKRYHVIGADTLIARMTIDGVSRKSIHKGKWDRVYELCINSLSSLEEIATKRRRNFILDQTNAYASAQRRKMKGFGDFKRIAVVCIPNEDELKRRNDDKSEKGNAFSIRDSTLNNLRANFTLPSLEFGWFDEIIYTDLSGDEAKDEVKKYNEKGKKALDANPSSRDKRNRRDYHHRDDRRRYDDHRRDFRNDTRRFSGNDRRGGPGGGPSGGNRWGGNNSGGGYNRGGSGGGWRDDRGYAGGGGGGGRGYDNRNRYSNSGGSQNNWMQNNRNRYDDRYNNRSSTGGARYESYGNVGGGGGGSRDYRDRDRNGSGGNGRRDNNYRSGGGNQQRDFRPGHRDSRTEDSRGGYERSSSSKHSSNDGYDQHNSGKSAATGKRSSAQGGKWASYSQHQKQQPGTLPAGNWQQYPQNSSIPQQQQYWSFDQTQGKL